MLCSVAGLISCLLSVAAHPIPDERSEPQPVVGDAAIIHALLQDVIAEARDIASPVGAPQIIALSEMTLAKCPPRVENPCVGEDILQRVSTEAVKGAWPLELVRVFQHVAESSAKLEALEFPGLVMGPKATLQTRSANLALLEITRPAVAADRALLYVQFAGHRNWLVLLSKLDSALKVTLTVPL